MGPNGCQRVTLAAQLLLNYPVRPVCRISTTLPLPRLSIAVSAPLILARAVPFSKSAIDMVSGPPIGPTEARHDRHMHDVKLVHLAFTDVEAVLGEQHVWRHRDAVVSVHGAGQLGCGRLSAAASGS